MIRIINDQKMIKKYADCVCQWWQSFADYAILIPKRKAPRFWSASDRHTKRSRSWNCILQWLSRVLRITTSAPFRGLCRFYIPLGECKADLPANKGRMTNALNWRWIWFFLGHSKAVHAVRQPGRCRVNCRRIFGADHARYLGRPDVPVYLNKAISNHSNRGSLLVWEWRSWSSVYIRYDKAQMDIAIYNE